MRDERSENREQTAIDENRVSVFFDLCFLISRVSVLSILLLQKVGNQLLAVIGENALGMELHAFDGQCAMAPAP